MWKLIALLALFIPQIYTVRQASGPNVFPKVPSNATTRTVFGAQPSNCPSTLDPTSNGQAAGCVSLDTKDATAAAGQGYPSPTRLDLNTCIPGYPSFCGDSIWLVNPPPVTPASTVGAAGAKIVTVNSSFRIIPGAVLTGTGIAAGTNVGNKCASGVANNTSGCYDGASTTVPIDTGLAAAVSSGITFTPTISANVLAFQHSIDSGGAGDTNMLYQITVWLNPNNKQHAQEIDPDNNKGGIATTVPSGFSNSGTDSNGNTTTKGISAEGYQSIQMGLEPSASGCGSGVVPPNCKIRLWNGNNQPPLTNATAITQCQASATGFGGWFERTSAYGCSENIRYASPLVLGVPFTFTFYSTFSFNVAAPANSMTCYETLSIKNEQTGVTVVPYQNIHYCLKDKLHSNSNYAGTAGQVQIDNASNAVRSTDARDGNQVIIANGTLKTWN